MNIKILKKINKNIRGFEEKEWEIADKEHYGQSYDWHHKNFVLVAYENDTIIGTLEFHVKVGVAEISTLIVASTQRRKGIGITLLQEAEKIAYKHNVHKMYLITGKGWKAENLYKSFGMTQTGDMPNHYANRDYVEYSKFI